MKVNVLKLVAALFVVASIIALYLNDFTYNSYALVLNIIGVILFMYAVVKDTNKKK